ncbi:unnamed protein product [Trichobilharzia regenti]|nr:unnamed protein product [Trichobilharzia regenti]
MTGQSLKLANLSAQKLIESLDVDDYFVVAHFPGAKDHSLPMIVTANNESEPICFNSFVQATKRNKLVSLILWIDSFAYQWYEGSST